MGKPERMRSPERVREMGHNLADLGERERASALDVGVRCTWSSSAAAAPIWVAGWMPAPMTRATCGLGI